MTNLDYINNKIHTDWSSLNTTLSLWNFKGYKVVFTNGCFDIIHKGHLEYLSKAADLGNKLVIGLNSDSSVKRLKGECRPVNSEDCRALFLASLEYVDKVILFEEDTPYELIKFIKPDILVKGSDYKAEDIVGYDVVTNKGGCVKTIDFTDGYSSTSIIEKIKKL